MDDGGYESRIIRPYFLGGVNVALGGGWAR